MVDKALEDVFASLQDDNDDDGERERKPRRKKSKTDKAAKTDWLQCFLSMALPQSRHQLIGDGSGLSGCSTLVLSIHHHNPLMRVAAVRRLGGCLKEEGLVRISLYIYINVVL